MHTFKIIKTPKQHASTAWVTCEVFFIVSSVELSQVFGHQLNSYPMGGMHMVLGVVKSGIKVDFILTRLHQSYTRPGQARGGGGGS